MLRRRAFAGMLLGTGSVLALSLQAVPLLRSAQAMQSTPRRVVIEARKFAFSVHEVHAQAGEALVLEIRSSDFVHGFALPELDRRVDTAPGRPAELALPPLRAGRYTFLCDNFCGEGHDRMTGTLVVAAAGSNDRR